MSSKPIAVNREPILLSNESLNQLTLRDKLISRGGTGGMGMIDTNDSVMSGRMVTS